MKRLIEPLIAVLFIFTALSIAYKIIAPPICNYICIVESYYPRQNGKYLTFNDEVKVVDKNNEKEVVIWIEKYNILDTLSQKELSTFFVPINSYQKNPSPTEM